VGVISPELALVDPELAAEARASLPDAPPAIPEARPAPAPHSGPAPPPPRTRHTLRRLAGVAVVGLAAVGTLFFVPRVDEEPSLAPSAAPPEPVAPAPARRRPPVAPPPAGRAPSSPPPRRSARPQPSAVRPQPPPAPVVRTAKPPAPQPPPAPPPPVAARKAPPPAPPPAREYTWAPTEGALFYHVSFTRNGQPFHDAQTRRPRLRVPAGLKFPPGRYRWSVRPALVSDSGLVVGEPVVVRRFRVTR
jgi:hypothetical protein